MTEVEWLSSTDPREMLEYIRGSNPPSDRQLRLFACACVRQVWHLLTDERSRRAVEVAERFADGRATRDELAVAREASWTEPGKDEPAQDAASFAAWDAAWAAARDS